MASQFITLIPLSSRKVVHTWDVWARALSCIKMNASPIVPAYDPTLRSRISLRCFASVIPPLANTYNILVGQVKVTRRKSMSRVRAVCMRLRRDNNIRKRSCVDVVTRDRHWPCSWCTLQSPSNFSLEGWLRSGTHQVSELPLEALHHLLAVA